MDLVPNPVRAVMQYLEARDATDRTDGTPHGQRLRAIAPEVGQFLMTLALASRAATIVEVGTGGGYSTLWLALVAERIGGRVTTFEIDPAKAALARRTFATAGLERFIDLRESDGCAGLLEFAGRADLVFVDSEKRDYVRLLGPAIEALRQGGLLVADNLTTHASELQTFRVEATADSRLSGLVVPLGGGEFVAVRL